MKRLWSITVKETLHILRDWRSLLILIFMPIVLVSIFGFAISNEIKDVKIAILDHSRDEHSQEISRRMIASNYFSVYSYVQTMEEAEQLFQSGKIKLVVAINPGFSSDLLREKQTEIQLIADASDPNTAATITNYASMILMNYQQDIFTQGKMNGYTIDIHNRMLFNPGLKSVFLFVPGVITVILMLICALMTSIALTREKEYGNMELLLVSPLKPGVVVLGKVLPYILLSFFDLIMILILGDLVFEVPIKGNLVFLLLESLLFIATVLSLGIFISTKTQNQQAAMIISLVGLFLPTILLSGFIFPIESMPKLLQWISNLMPARWFIVIIKNIMLKGTGIAFLWKETLILLVMTLIFIVLSIKNYKIRLE
jgi:ABC-2 type transport system permease protein